MLCWTMVYFSDEIESKSMTSRYYGSKIFESQQCGA